MNFWYGFIGFFNSELFGEMLAIAIFAAVFAGMCVILLSIAFFDDN